MQQSNIETPSDQSQEQLKLKTHQKNWTKKKKNGTSPDSNRERPRLVMAKEMQSCVPFWIELSMLASKKMNNQLFYALINRSTSWFELGFGRGYILWSISSPPSFSPTTHLPSFLPPKGSFFFLLFLRLLTRLHFQ